MAEEVKVKVGDRVKYRIDGFAGIATGITHYLFQCSQVHVAPEDLDKDGKAKAGRWIDEPWLDIVKAAVHAPRAAVTVRGRAVSGAPNREHPAER
jgi:hypothetical protein